MKIAKFNTLVEAENKLQEFNDLASSPTSSQPFSLTSIRFSKDFCWFSFTDCINQSGNKLNEILEKQSELDLQEVSDDYSGIITSYSPEEIGINAAYSDFDFSDLSVLKTIDSKIISVANKGNSSVSLSQSITAARPRTGVNSQNELNVASFDGLEFLNFSNNSVISKEFTIFLVGKSNPTSNTQAFIGRYKNPAAGHWLFGRRLATNRFFTQAYSDSSSSSASDPSNNNANIHCITFKDGESISYYLNNSKRRAGTKLSGFSDNKIGLALGAANGEGLLPLRGWIGQVLIYEKLLDDTRIGKVYELLSKNWGIN